MKVLVTGGAGYIGSHTVVELLSCGHDVVVVDNLANSSEIAIHKIKEIVNKPFIFIKGDICDYELMDKVFRKNNIDSIIHFAGLKSNAESIDNPGLYYHVNFDSTFVLTEMMKKYHVKNLVFSSSATVYGSAEVVPVKETDTVGIVLSPYGFSKYLNELFLSDFVKQQKNYSVIALRYFNPIGAHPSGIIGEDARQSIPNNLLPYLMKAASGQLPYLRIFGDDYETRDGTGERDYIHVVDLARGHIAALNYLSKSMGCFEAINLGTGRGTTVMEFLRAFEEVNNVKIPYKIVGRRQGDMARSFADVSKAKNMLGWVTKLDIRDCARDSWNWQKKNPNGYEQ